MLCVYLVVVGVLLLAVGFVFDWFGFVVWVEECCGGFGCLR